MDNGTTIKKKTSSKWNKPSSKWNNPNFNRTTLTQNGLIIRVFQARVNTTY